MESYPAVQPILLSRRACLASAFGLLLSGTPAHAAPPTSGPQKIILDTDIGDDIDDAYALALLASRREIQLLGVTTTFGATRKRAQLAAKLLHVMGRNDVPVFAGRRTSDRIGRQAEWARGFHSSTLKSEPAAGFLARQIERWPGEITLVGIGPMVNLGDLLRQRPELAPKIGRIVIMGGSVYTGYGNSPVPSAEWNVRADLAAARAVFTGGAPLVMAGLEVTAMMQLAADRRRRIFAYGSRTTDALAALTALWGGDTPTLFDPVAAAYALGHNVGEREERHLDVDDAGMTRIAPGTPNVSVLVHPRPDEFLDWYVQSLATTP